MDRKSNMESTNGIEQCRPVIKQIFDYLQTQGFSMLDDITATKKETKVVQQMVINGQAMNKTADVITTFIYVDEGYIENIDGTAHMVMTQWKLLINDEDNGDWMVESLDDFRKTFKI